MAPVDIIVTKAGRLDLRDMGDIEACIRKFRLTKKSITRRGREVRYVGNRGALTATSSP